MDDAYALLLDASAELGGRLLVVDASGKVQLDTFCLLETTRLELPETTSVLTGSDAYAYAIRNADGDRRYDAGGSDDSYADHRAHGYADDFARAHADHQPESGVYDSALWRQER